MISVGIVKSVDGYKCEVEISGVEVSAVMLLPVCGQATTLLQVKTGTQVLVFVQQTDAIVLGVVPCEDDLKPETIYFKEVLRLLKTLVYNTPQGPTTGLLPNSAVDVTMLENEIEKINI